MHPGQAQSVKSLLVFPAIIAGMLATSHTCAAGIVVTPSSIELKGPETSWQLLVHRVDGNSRVDLTRSVQYLVQNPLIAVVDGHGKVESRSEGRTEILVSHPEGQIRIPVVVTAFANPVPVSFSEQVIPILNKAGCNSGSCHGKAEGQNGFKLSVFGFDPVADYQALTREGRGRRVLQAAADESLLIRKALGLMPHGGGRKIEKGSLAHRRLQRWITEGCGWMDSTKAAVVRIEVEPDLVVLRPRGTQQLRVVAIDAAGGRTCVTNETEFESNAPGYAGVDRLGAIEAGEFPGEAAVLVRYMGHVSVCRVTIPRSGVRFPRLPEANFVDHHVWNKLEQLGIPPSPRADDATFLRRVFLDVIGTLPTADEARTFLDSKSPNKRETLIDQLLARPEYADYWAMRWADLLRVDRDAVTSLGAVAMTRWLRRQFASNRPYDAFVRDLLTARGSVGAEGPAAFYKALGSAETMSRSVSQLLLGVRIECAQCHHHPSERWGQEDYYGLAGFFTGVATKPLPDGTPAIVAGPGTDLVHPRTGKAVPARTLGSQPADFTKATDRRRVLAEWVTSPANPYFARALANRLWAHYFGRGLVEPIDDLRATNPPTNEPLLAALADHLRHERYDLRAFTRTILTSNAYQLSSATLSENAGDLQNYSHAPTKALPAEVLLDAVCQVTGAPERFNGWPEGYRAIQVWDNRLPSYFLQIFGRPGRVSVCECERSPEPSIAQALHLLNSPEIAAKLRSSSGRVHQLAESALTPDQIIDELSLAAIARKPTEQERGVFLASFREAGQDRKAAVEDILWSLLNWKEFLYNR